MIYFIAWALCVIFIYFSAIYLIKKEVYLNTYGINKNGRTIGENIKSSGLLDEDKSILKGILIAAVITPLGLSVVMYFVIKILIIHQYIKDSGETKLDKMVRKAENKRKNEAPEEFI